MGTDGEDVKDIVALSHFTYRGLTKEGRDCKGLRMTPALLSWAWPSLLAARVRTSSVGGVQRGTRQRYVSLPLLPTILRTVQLFAAASGMHCTLHGPFTSCLLVFWSAIAVDGGSPAFSSRSIDPFSGHQSTVFIMTRSQLRGCCTGVAFFCHRPFASRVRHSNSTHPRLIYWSTGPSDVPLSGRHR